jgi:hypothetical protein
MLAIPAREGWLPPSPLWGGAGVGVPAQTIPVAIAPPPVPPLRSGHPPHKGEGFDRRCSSLQLHRASRGEVDEHGDERR